MYDVAIIGLGCAGYTSAIYCARYKLSTFLVGAVEGGTGLAAAEVGDWPGTEFIKGPELMEKMSKHAQSFESVTHKVGKVMKVMRVDQAFRLTMESGETVDAKTLIFAMGAENRKLDVLGEKEFAGKGVTYCATCDAYFYKGKDVAVVGGGDAAVEGAAIAAQVAKKVYLIHRRNEFRATPYWVERVQLRDNVEFVLGRNVVEVLGDTKVTGVKIDKPWNNSDTIKVDGVFVEIGAVPLVDLPKRLGCEIDERGHMKVDAGMRSNIKGVFGAGDITSGSNHFAQFVTAAGEGSIAAHSVFNYLQGN
jgi:thioredoxin reductase (NADPH)